MIDRKALLDDLQKLLKELEKDLLARSDDDEVPEVRASLKEEFNRAKKAKRTALSYSVWLTDYVTQMAAAWVLSCVFARFLEDNQLVSPVKISGPGDALQMARDQYEIYVRANPTKTDRDYLLRVFTDLATQPGCEEIFGSHSLIQQLPNWLSGDAAKELLVFFREIDPNTGGLVHDFTDSDWNTRFLGDLYQDLSESARKKYALLQTPDFVEEFILDRTLDPALNEFGLNAPAITNEVGEKITQRGFRMIDPACGSGHFLLGAFPRILSRWREKEPGTNVRELVQRTLNSINGVDINPFAIAIARFRLLLAALKASDVRRLADAPPFQLNLACGDSLYHGVKKQQLMDFTDESHYFQTEDAQTLNRILREGTFHAVVANPPYITPKDDAANQAYRKLYATCHRKYSLAVPFMERIFNLVIRTDNNTPASGFTGQITANSFMKREFGKKLIEEFFRSIDLTHILDVSGAYIPGHNGQEGGTSTAIIFGRNRSPVDENIRTLMGIDGEPGTPDVAREGQVWNAIVSQIDQPGSQSRFVSAADTPRESFESHPWSLGGGGVAGLVELLEMRASHRLGDIAEAIGYGINIGEDDAFVDEERLYFKRIGVVDGTKAMPAGEQIRHFAFAELPMALFPYSEDLEFVAPRGAETHYWVQRTILRNVLFHKKKHEERGLDWRQYAIVVEDKVNRPRGLVYAFVATHNHFAFDRTGFLSTKSAPGVYLPLDASEEDYLSILGVLATSTVCFWLRNSTYLTGGSGDAWSMRGQFSASTVSRIPLPHKRTSAVADRLDAELRELVNSSPAATLLRLSSPHLSIALANAENATSVARGKMILLQEDLDWQAYRLYGLIDEDLTCDADSFGIQLGERAFEITLARKIASGEVQTTWFERHGSTPITELPEHWPDDYRQLVEQRIEVIESDPLIALIEQPEYKRRWNTESWDSQVEGALKSWLLDRLESFFDFDGRMNDGDEPTAKFDVGVVSVGQLADMAAKDAQFMEVGEVYKNDAAFDVPRLIEDLVKTKHVPLLPVLRYKESGLRNRKEWEQTWELQRAEDRIDARTELPEDDPDYLTKSAAGELKKNEIGDIPVPPKYKSSDFISTGGVNYWKLRGKLDVPKERWVSFPHCEGSDGTLIIAWAGYDHLQLALAISGHFIHIRDEIGGSDDPRLVPLLAGLMELLPWLRQWHHDIHPEYDQRMDEYFDTFIKSNASELRLSLEEIAGWKPA